LGLLGLPGPHGMAQAASPGGSAGTPPGLTWEEKIGQMILVYHSPYSFLRQYHVGGVLIMSGMLKQPGRLAEDIAATQEKLPIKLFVTMDQEGGKVNRLSSLPAWKSIPPVSELGKLPPDSIVRHNRRVARALKELGVNMNLAPVLDPSHDWQGRSTFIHLEGRSFGRTAEEILPPANAFMDGFRDEGIACVSKHFPGYDVQENSDHHIAVSDADSASVARGMEAFSRSSGRVAGMMVSSIHYRKLSDRPSVLSPEIVGLARRIAPDLVLMTDDLWGAALRAYAGGKPEVDPVHYPDADFRKLVEMAFWAGNDVFMITFPAKVPLIQAVLLELARNDAAARERIDASVARILAAKANMGLAPGIPPGSKPPAAYAPVK
jgi:beta-N-acetylhexosaminidase